MCRELFKLESLVFGYKGAAVDWFNLHIIVQSVTVAEQGDIEWLALNRAPLRFCLRKTVTSVCRQLLVR